MKFLVLSDLHANNSVLDKLDKEFEKADAVLFAGDFAECFKPETGKASLEALATKHENIFAVLGNCDNPDFIEQMEERDVSVEKSLTYFDGLSICGSGGGTIFTGKTENERTEEDILSDYNIVLNTIAETNDQSLWKSLILISHNPPKDTLCDKVNETLHAGSQLFTDFIKEHQPLLVVTGHIHEGRAIDKIGETVIMNPGALLENNYGWIEIEMENGQWKVTKSELLKV